MIILCIASFILGLMVSELRMVIDLIKYKEELKKCLHVFTKIKPRCDINQQLKSNCYARYDAIMQLFKLKENTQ